MYDIIAKYCCHLETNLNDGTPAQKAFSRSILLNKPEIFLENDFGLEIYEKNIANLIVEYFCCKNYTPARFKKLRASDKDQILNLFNKKRSLKVRAMLPGSGEVQTLNRFANKTTNGISVDGIFIHDLNKSIFELNSEKINFYGLGQCDYFLVQMLEWNYMPDKVRLNAQSNITPVIAQTSDFDIHIEVIKDRINNVDVLTTIDGSEREKLEALIENVYENPFAFGQKSTRNQFLHPDEKKHDVLISGQSIHYSDTKRNALIQRISSILGCEIFDYLPPEEYQAKLRQARAVFCFARNKRTLLTRAFDALNSGCLPILPKDNMLTHLLPSGTFLTFDDENIPTSEEIENAYIKFWKLRKSIPSFHWKVVGEKYLLLNYIFKLLWQKKLIKNPKCKFRETKETNFLHVVSAHRAWLPEPSFRIRLCENEVQRITDLVHTATDTEEFLIYENLGFRAKCIAQLAHRSLGHNFDSSAYNDLIDFYYIANSSRDLMTNINCLRAMAVIPNSDLQNYATEIADNFIHNIENYDVNNEIPALPYDFWGALFNYQVYSDYMFSKSNQKIRLKLLAVDTAIIVKVLLEGSEELLNKISFETTLSKDIRASLNSTDLPQEQSYYRMDKFFNAEFPFQYRFKPMFKNIEK
jgi:hypothetical protein